MAGKQTDTFPYDLNCIELNEAELDKLFNIATKHPEVVERFDTPIRLTSEENEPVLWAVGRSQSGELMVESRYDDETYPARPFGSFVTHAEELALEAMQSSNYKTLQKSNALDEVHNDASLLARYNAEKRIWIKNTTDFFRLGIPLSSTILTEKIQHIETSETIKISKTYEKNNYENTLIAGYINNNSESYVVDNASGTPIGFLLEGGDSTDNESNNIKKTILTLEEIKGLNSGNISKMKSAGITTSIALLEQGSTHEGRFALAKVTNIPEELIFEWVNRIDFSRINGITRQFNDLLEVIGIDTIEELAARIPSNLAKNLAEVNTGNKIAERSPTLAEVEDWINQAKKISRIIHH
jgi:hypothetical protein